MTWMTSVLYWVASWTALYYTSVRYFSKQSAEWSCRSVTLLHGVVCIALSGYSGFVEGPWPFTDPAGPNTAVQTFLMQLSLGYFLFDFTWCLIYQTEGVVMLLHHLVTIAFYTVSLATGYYGCEVNAVVFGSEVTNPFLQIRWFMRSVGKYSSLWGLLVDLAFVSLFTLVRIGVGAVLALSYFANARPPLWMKCGGAVMYAIGLVFWYQILRMIVRRVFRRSGHAASATYAPSPCHTSRPTLAKRD